MNDAVMAARTWSISLLVSGAGLTAVAIACEASSGWPHGVWSSIADALTDVSWLVAGGVAAYVRPRMSVGYLLLLGGLFLALSGALTAWAGYLATADADAGAVAWIGWVGGWIFWPHLAALAIVYLLFPDGTLPSRRWWPAVVLPVAAVVAGMLATALAPGALASEGPLATVMNPIGGVAGVEALLPVAVIGLNITFVLGLIALRVRPTLPAVRGAVRLVFWLGLFNLAVGVALISPPGPWIYLLAVPATMSLTAAICVEVVRGPLWDVRATIGRTLVYLLLSGVVVIVFVSIVTIVGAATNKGTGQLIGIPIAALVVCLVLTPTQQWLRRRIERRLFGDRGQPYAVLSAFGGVLETAGEPREALQRLVDLAADACRVPWVAVLIPAAGEVPVASSGSATNREIAIPLRHQGREQGTLRVGKRAGEEDFPASDIRLLEDLAHQAGAAAYALALEATLRRHSADLLAVRDEERRRLRRDLHDGVASRVTAVRLTLDVAADQLPDETERSSTLIRRANSELEATLDEVRRILDDLGPAEPIDLGLSGALTVLAARFSNDTLTVTPKVDVDIDTVDTEIAAAAYWIASEALTNIARHAGATTGTLNASLHNATLTLRVDDDGTGIAPHARVGVGSLSMRSRAETCGGTLQIGGSDMGGAAVQVTLPWRARHG